MAAPVERLLGDYGGANAPTGRMTIVNQPVDVAHFQLHPATIRQLEKKPFSGRINEDANKHLQRFLTMTTSLKIEGHSEEAKKLVMFPFTLSDDAEEWFYSLPAGTAGGSTNFKTATEIKKIIDAIAANEHLELYDRSVNQPEGLIDLKLSNQVVKMEDQIVAEVERRLKQMALEKQTVAQVQPAQPIQAMSQIAQQLANAQPQGALPSATVTNPREHQNVNVISTRSLRRSKPEEKSEIEYDDIIEVDLEVRENKKVPEEVIQPVKPTEEKRRKEPTPLIKLPYPSRVAKKDQKEKDFEKKFMKEVISKKKPTRGEGVVKKEKCCAISPEKRIPIKQKDPGSVAIPCTIKNRTFMKVLIDSGASVSLMPLSIFKKLGIQKVSERGTELKFADHTMKRSYGVAEDVLVEIDKFVFPVDFEIMDIPEDEETPIILGRPFLRTSRCNVDIEKGTLTLKSFDEEITLKVLDTKKQGESGDNQSSVGMIHIVGKSKRSEPTPKKVSSIISQVAASHIKTPKSNKEIKERKKKEHQGKEMEVESDLRHKVFHPLNLDEFWVAERTSKMVWKRKYPP
ncbi:uncharacterized protein LOC131644427 [Vicia villosa]|uniref:uncharacterized protein LOC131644427 n=1 Tax=Vicia villosa TaxID=3911 RepID=UPI00273C6EC6|nr:uncharacterized protein LOC131644427 [Vicia villosa]